MRKKDRIKKRDGNKCLLCGSTSNLTVDHIIPKHRGGHNGESNLQTLCATCNEDKGHSNKINYRIAKKELFKKLINILRDK